MPSGKQRFARQQIDRALQQHQHGEVAVVTAVAATGGTDSQPLATVTHNGASVQYPHLSAYSPAVGDVVAVHPWGGTYLIVGKPVGFPPST
jgi:hypothetical protein